VKIPRLKPLQIVGLVCVVLFGIRLVILLRMPKRDPFFLPGALPMHGTLENARDHSLSPEDLESPPLFALPPTIPAPDAKTPNLLEIGPQDARDDLYCSGIIHAFHRTQVDSFSADAQQRRDKIIALAERGTARLLSSGAVQPGGTAAVADAHSERALADYANGSARFTVEEAMRR
jgi:hypothetical protein